MSQAHLDRLTAVDASFLAQESDANHMHVGGVFIFEGPPPAFTDVLEGIRGRLHLVPRYRQRLVLPPAETGRPLWADDPTFNLEYHVRHSALPRPGSDQQLYHLAARIVSQQLDRSKPLWEFWLVEGLEHDRFALVAKTHHALVDGISGVDLMSALFDLTPEPQEIEHPDRPWTPHPEPSQAELIAAGLRDAAKRVAGLVGGATSAVTRPQEVAAKVRESSEAIGEVVWAGLNPAPETPLNVPIGPHRRFAPVSCDLEDFKKVKNALGGTVNDVVLTVVAGALARWLRARGVRTEGLELRALVPVSIRTEDEHHQLGNRIAAMRGPLPVYVRDPVQRLAVVREAMDGLKDSKQALGAEVLAGLQGFAPPTLLAVASRLNFSTRLFNLIVTNVPGPQFPLYVQGRELQYLYPIAFLPRDHALAVAIISYNGGINFGLLGDLDALPDIGIIAEGIEDSLAELLVAAAKKRTDGGGGRRASRPRAATRNGRAPAETPAG